MARDSGSRIEPSNHPELVNNINGLRRPGPPPPAEVAPALFFSNNPVKIPTE